MKKVFLVGYMGVGKTGLGKRLANALSIPSYDLDEEIVKKEGKSIKELFENGGERRFRELESRMLKDFCHQKKSFVLSTGGGTAASQGNMEAMKDAGTVVWLDIPVEMILNRLSKSEDRPLLKDVAPEDRLDFIKAHFAERQPQYQKAHIKFEASDVNSAKLAELVEEIQSR
jgi:shikimate kinase